MGICFKRLRATRKSSATSKKKKSGAFLFRLLKDCVPCIITKFYIVISNQLTCFSIKMALQNLVT